MCVCVCRYVASCKCFQQQLLYSNRYDVTLSKSTVGPVRSNRVQNDRVRRIARTKKRFRSKSEACRTPAVLATAKRQQCAKRRDKFVRFMRFYNYVCRVIQSKFVFKINFTHNWYGRCAAISVRRTEWSYDVLSTCSITLRLTRYVSLFVSDVAKRIARRDAVNRKSRTCILLSPPAQ